MAVTSRPYNHTAKLLMMGEVNYTSLKLVLLNSSAVFDPAHTTLSQVTSAGANDVDGFGWPAGGQTLTGVAGSIVNTNDGKLGADNIAVGAVGGDIGPAFYGVIIDDDDVPLWNIDLGGSQTAASGNDFNVDLSAGIGIIRSPGP